MRAHLLGRALAAALRTVPSVQCERTAALSVREAVEHQVEDVVGPESAPEAASIARSRRRSSGSLREPP
ncbi:MAG: hypothetical protein V9G19_27740 [Tetrasphaera sp.]